MASVPSFSGLNTALRGVVAQQRALDITGHNIANVETQGYSRQEAVFAAAPTLNIGAGMLQQGAGAQLGQGVDVEQYRRLRNDFLDLQWRGQNMGAADAEVRSSRLMQLEAALNDPTAGGLGQRLGAFYDAWSDLAAHPESGAARSAVYAAAENLMTGLHDLDSSLTAVATEANDRIAGLLAPNGTIDRIAQEITQLNDRINRDLMAGITPNDMMDRRDLLLDQLSQYGQVSTSVPNPARPGWVEVRFANAATPLVDNSAGPPVTLPTPASIQPPATAPGGELTGLLAVGTYVTGYRAALDSMTSRLVTTVNGAHGAPAFFDGAGLTAATVAFGAGLTGPAAITAGSGPAGDNSVALAVAQLRNPAGGSVTGDWAALVSQVGTDLATQKSGRTTAQRVLDSLTAQRTSTHGVSLDEEMTNMLRFQRGYQAAARALTAMDENLDILINRTGRVGL